MLKGYQYLAKTLKAYGATHLFFQAAVLWKGVKEAADSGITCVRAHSETAAGYMADGYARIAKRPGICAAQSIGSANLVAGIHDAWLATSPVIALTGRRTSAFQDRNTYQESDHKALFSGVTKFNCDVSDPMQFPFVLRQCFREAVTGKMRPVHMDLLGCNGEIFEEAEFDEPVYADPGFGSYPAFRPAADEGMIREAAAEINAAQRPLIIAGRGAHISGAGKAILELAQKGDIPVATTVDGKTIIDEGDPYWAGVLGFYGMSCTNKAAMESDLVIIVGSKTSDQTTMSWQAPQRDKKVIQIDIAPDELGRNYPNSTVLLGDARVVVEQLTRAAEEKKRTGWREQAAVWLAGYLREQDELAKDEGVPIATAYLCKALSELMPDNAVLVSDTGYSAIWSATAVRMKSTQDFVRTSGTLGWAFPAAIGVKCGVPDRPVICLCGDGGFYYHLQEIETAVRSNIKTITVVNNNRMFAQNYHETLDEVYSRDEAKAKEYVGFGDVDFAGVAEMLGARGIRVNRPEELRPAFERALAADRAVVLDVRTGTGVNPISSK
ncbi:MAG: thiamine pyrophosphate-binding protein [Oscillospiraceae bacterium]|jgi:acetolactate synthase-1/2/3 large subunit|nr:thiamine pyrophosphate-binding protein [Oscillospiraceae bacterium]